MSEPYRTITERGQKVKVDHDGSCDEQHPSLSPPLFHVIRSEKSTPWLARCPKSLTPSERERLKP